ncbi:glutathione S-transferase 3, mitochondrial-like [Haliotis cracherodii]|uniref:glutathione S-transferase 3, mitochondrial-like n=1 Tax=Haliotis cracherodii TaxID=6455 RepID=UPI0039ED6674
MGVSVEIQSDFGYVVLVIVATWVLLNWLGLQVVKARRKYEVNYPIMYCTDTFGDGHMFNCVQRAHQNTLEVYPVTLVLLIFGGLEFPKVSAFCGVVWILSRVVYAYGYYTGDPSKRTRGTFGYAGLLVLLVNSIIFALDILDFV